jgi:hypothetical protein
MKLFDIRLNFQMTVHAWAFVFGDKGHLFAFETASPCNGLLCGDNELSIKFDVRDHVPSIFGAWDREDSTAIDASGLIRNWKIYNF